MGKREFNIPDVVLIWGGILVIVLATAIRADIIRFGWGATEADTAPVLPTPAPDVTPDAAYYLQLALDALIRHDYDQSLLAYNELIAQEPKNGGYYAQRGDVQFHRLDYAAAIEDYTLAIGTGFDNYYMYYLRGRAYVELGDLPMAIRDFNYALKLFDGDAMVYAARGIAYTKQGDYARAFTDLEQALAKDDSDPFVYWALAFYYDEQGKTDDALVYYKRYLELTGENADADIEQRVRELKTQSQ